MRRTALAVVVLSSLMSLPAAAQDPKADVLATVHDFLRGLKTKDLTLLTAQLDSVTRFTLVRPGPNGPRVVVLTGAGFIQAVTGPNSTGVDEPIRNPVVQVDRDIATVWTEYQVRTPTGVSHCGYDAFHLARLGGKWKIVNLIDSFRPQAECGPRWPD